jgi:hypothetical protein
VDVSTRPQGSRPARSRWRVAASVLAACTLTGAALTAGTGMAMAAMATPSTVSCTDHAAIALSPASVATASPVSVATTSLAAGTVGVEYFTELSATGGITPYKWAVVGGQVPSGLTLTTGGVLAGTPTKSGTYNFTVQVTDTTAATATQALKLVVNAGSLTIGETSLPQAVAGTSYSTTLSAAGGSGSYLWSIVSGSLPSGLTLNVTTGVISGKATGAGTSAFTVQVTDSDGDIGTASLSITVTGSSLAIATAGFPSTGSDAWFAHAVAASGGSGSNRWSVTKGSLPPGLHLNASNGWITGRATVTGKYTFTVRATDSAGVSATRSLTIWVNGPVIGNMYVANASGPCSATVVHIYGSGLSGNKKHPEYRVSVRFGSHRGRLLSASSNAITVVPPSGRGTVQVTVTVYGVSNQATKAARFHY